MPVQVITEIADATRHDTDYMGMSERNKEAIAGQKALLRTEQKGYVASSTELVQTQRLHSTSLEPSGENFNCCIGRVLHLDSRL
jgi:hypothetical protein